MGLIDENRGRCEGLLVVYSEGAFWVGDSHGWICVEQACSAGVFFCFLGLLVRRALLRYVAC